MSRFHTILVPIDFSNHSDAALALAIELAKEAGGEIHLLHAYEMPVSLTMSYGVAIPQSVWDDVKEAADARLAEIQKRLQTAGVKGTTHLLIAPPADAIAECAASHHVDLIVMGTRGLTGLRHVLLGSVAERTIRIAPCPVLTIKGAPD